jgi:hypothetical protein
MSESQSKAKVDIPPLKTSAFSLPPRRTSFTGIVQKQLQLLVPTRASKELEKVHPMTPPKYGNQSQKVRDF